MTIWEKVIVNLEKGAKKTTIWAALFSDRIKAEIEIARLRIRVDEVRSRINEQYRIIGRKISELDKKDDLGAVNQLVKEEDITTALDEIRAREKDLEDIYNQIANEQTAFKTAEKSAEKTGEDYQA